MNNNLQVTTTSLHVTSIYIHALHEDVDGQQLMTISSYVTWRDRLTTPNNHTKCDVSIMVQRCWNWLKRDNLDDGEIQVRYRGDSIQERYW